MAQQGTVKWYNPEKGYGFITRERGEDVFLHQAGFAPGVETVHEGQRVTFDVVDGPKGPQAKNVKPADG